METVNRDVVVVGLRRYPVKAMGGESLEAAELDTRGLVGDRAFAVIDGKGKFASGKNTKRMARRLGVFEFSARTMRSDADEPEVSIAHDGRDWRPGDSELDAHLTEVLRAEVHVGRDAGSEHFDDGAVSLVGTATLDWCARELGVDADPRRLRVNLVVETSEPFEEESWTGEVTVGGVTLRPAGRVERCVTIDAVQDGVAQRTRWLKPLGDKRNACLAIYLDVVRPGVVHLGDRVIPS